MDNGLGFWKTAFQKPNIGERRRKKQSECDGLKEQEKREHLETVPERI